MDVCVCVYLSQIKNTLITTLNHSKKTQFYIRMALKY